MIEDSRFIKHDVMISYSTKRADIAKDIVALLLENNYSVWIAPESIPSGVNYVDEIYSAIDNCKVVLFILCEESLGSTWCQRELCYAINQNKSVLPVQISECDNPYSKLGEIKKPLERKQILSLFPDYADKLNLIIDGVNNLINNKIAVGLRPYPKDSYSFFADADVFVGRETETKAIRDLIKKCRIVNVYGMGGIGKTAFLKNFAAKFCSIDAYRSIHVKAFTNTLEETIAEIPFFGFDDVEYLDSLKDETISKTRALYQRKMELLQNVSTECLLIIDGADYLSEEELLPLASVSCSVIISSRNRYRNYEGFLLPPPSVQDLENMFYAYSGLENLPKQTEYIDKIIERSGNHTLTVKLIACYCADLGYTAEDIVTQGFMDDLAEFDNESEKVSTLFNFSRLSKDELYAMQVLSLFPHGVSKGTLQKIDRELLKKYPPLVRKGWVNGGETFALHQIVRECVAKNTTISTLTIKPFLQRFVEIFRIIGLSDSELSVVVRQMLNVVSGEDRLMVVLLHRFGNFFCDIAYERLFHVEKATYAAQDMNFVNQKNTNNEKLEMYELSRKTNLRAYELAKKINLNEPELTAYILSYIGSSYFNENNFGLALEYQLRALKEIENPIPIIGANYIVILNRIGLSAFEYGDLVTAERAFLKYIGVVSENHIQNGNLAMGEFNLANIYYRQDDLKKAEEFYLYALNHNTDDMAISFGMSEIYLSLADICSRTNRAKQAKNYYLMSRNIKCNIINDKDKLNEFLNKYDILYLNDNFSVKQ